METNSNDSQTLWATTYHGQINSVSCRDELIGK